MKRSVERAHRVEPRKATPVDEAIGRQIRKRRRMLGMSQYQLARAIGIASQQIQKYEIGANRLSVSRLVEIADVLKVPIAWFFRNIESPAQRGALDPHQRTHARLPTERGRKTK